jgi:hypothetical protein
VAEAIGVSETNAYEGPIALGSQSGPHPERMSRHDVAVAKSADDMITIAAVTSLGTYFMIGRKITVSARKFSWLCHTCLAYETADHKGCEHIKRAKRWAEEHQVAA